MDINNELQELQNKIVRKKKINAMLEDLRRQNDELIEREELLLNEKLKEQKDVEFLEGGSLASFFYSVIGRKEEKINKEQAEAYAASVKYDSIVMQHNEITNQIASLQNELKTLYDCENNYKKRMEEKTEWLKVNNAEMKEEIGQREERTYTIKGEIKEISEALTAGQNVMNLIESIEEELSSAEGWGTWDLLGGGLLSDMAKHSHLDDAQDMIQQLQELLRRFRTELADITISADIQVQIEGFLRFADYFFDGLFADWAVLDSIHSSQEQLDETKSKVASVINKLESLKNKAENQITSIATELEELIQRV